MSGLLDAKVALIAGIGRATAVRLAEKSARVLEVFRSMKRTAHCVGLLSLIAASIPSCRASEHKRSEVHEIAGRDARVVGIENGHSTVENQPSRPKLNRSGQIPETIRLYLRRHMLNHGDDMESLLWSALMLDFQSTSAIADRMLLSPQLSRATAAAGDTLNQHLPPMFFTLQNGLRQSLATLKAAADSENKDQLADAYARIAETCIRCHGLYLEISSSPSD